MAYILDANVFIAAQRLHYGLDFCPAFWDWLVTNNQSGNVFSIENVEDEIGEQNLGDRCKWMDQNGSLATLCQDLEPLCSGSL